VSVLRNKPHRLSAKLRVALVACAVLLVSTPGVLHTPVARAATDYYAEGFDTCTDPLTNAKLLAWWNNTPIWTVGLYLGGEDGATVGCTGLTPTTWGYALSLGYGIEPFWYGAQMNPSQGCGEGDPGLPAYVSLNTNTAYVQGESEASQAAVAAGTQYGVPYGSVIYLDLEAFYNNSGCVAAAESFVQGWDNYLDSVTQFVPGLYGSSFASYLSNMTNAPVPAAIAPADPGVDYTGVYGLQCLSDGLWNQNQRIHQDTGEVWTQFGGQYLSVDEDCADGPVINGGGQPHNCAYFYHP